MTPHDTIFGNGAATVASPCREAPETRRRTDLVLAKIDRAKAYLAEATTLQQVKEVIALADAARIYGKRMKASKEVTNYASAVRLRAECRLAEMWVPKPKATGGDAQRTRFKKGTESPPTIDEAGLTKKENSRLLDLASMSDAEFETALVPEKGKELNHNRVVKLAREKRQREARKEKRAAAAKGTKLDSRIIVGDFRKHADKVADGGSLVAYVGHLQLPAAFVAFNGKLRHWWTCACVHSGPKALMREYGIRVGWKPMLWFVKGTRDERHHIISDTVTGRREKDSHD